ncbi:MAG: ribose 5-phosphate isomerase B [Planctomycetes bacterium]|nr:ribose 5-phosphate isomerase B [Planctomycetota bacterium]
MAAQRAGRALVIAPGAIVTPLARDAIERHKVELRDAPDDAAALRSLGAELSPPPAGCAKGQVAIAADHGGFEMKRMLIDFLRREAGMLCLDLGTHSNEAVDYPDFAHKVAREVAAGRACRGIIVDGAGIGSAMVANKYAGVRAANCTTVAAATNAREHNDANVLTLGGRMIEDELARAIAIVFLKTDFGGGRHAQRVAKIEPGRS